MPKIKNYQSKNKKKIKIIAMAIVCILLIVLGFFIFELKFKNKNPDSAKTSSTAATAQEDFTNGGDRTPVNNPKNEGTLQDNSGVVSAITPESQWSTSKDSAITVFNPAPNSILKSGSQISGKSAYSEVSFRLIDDVQGVISQGNIKVINGTYAGIMNFSTQGKVGRLDIFKTNSEGIEKSNVEILLRY